MENPPHQPPLFPPIIKRLKLTSDVLKVGDLEIGFERGKRSQKNIEEVAKRLDFMGTDLSTKNLQEC